MSIPPSSNWSASRPRPFIGDRAGGGGVRGCCAPPFFSLLSFSRSAVRFRLNWFFQTNRFEHFFAIFAKTSQAVDPWFNPPFIRHFPFEDRRWKWIHRGERALFGCFASRRGEELLLPSTSKELNDVHLTLSSFLVSPLCGRERSRKRWSAT